MRQLRGHRRSKVKKRTAGRGKSTWKNLETGEKANPVQGSKKSFDDRKKLGR